MYFIHYKRTSLRDVPGAGVARTGARTGRALIRALRARTSALVRAHAPAWGRVSTSRTCFARRPYRAGNRELALFLPGTELENQKRVRNREKVAELATK